MIADTKRDYIQVFKSDGDTIERPDLMLLAALATPNPVNIQHLYATMLLEEKLNPADQGRGLSEFAASANKRFIEASIQQRVLAGEVMLEIARVKAATGKSLSLNAARRLVSFKHKKFIALATASTVEREVESSFRNFRNTAHLQGVTACFPAILAEIEGCEASTFRFLGLARWLEIIMDECAVPRRFTWSPLRVPEQIAPINSFDFVPLSEEELRIAGVV